MSKLEIILIITGGLLLIIAAALLVRLYQYKRQMRLFTEMVKRRKAIDVNSPVTVEYFHKDVIGLAMALNEYTDLVKTQVIGLEHDRKQLRNVVAGISHDFRTPLTAAKGYLQIIDKSQILKEDDEEYLNIVIAKIDYLKKLSDTFFEVAALEADTDREQVFIEDVPFNKLLSEQILSQYEWISSRNIEVSFDIEEKDIFIPGTRQNVNRILENLFSNACKYTVSQLSVILRQNDDGIYFEMANDMEPDENLDINMVFTPFYRESARHSEGTGLGLYVVKTIADKFDYKVYAEKNENIFKICIESSLK